MSGTYDFVLTGKNPLLMHEDDVMAADEIEAWRKDPENKSQKKPGDDRVPAWTWQKYLYMGSTNLVIPSDNLMACLRKAGASISMGNKKTAKALSQSSIIMPNEHLDFFCNGKPVPVEPIARLASLPFKQQFDGVKKLGFELLVKRASVGSAKHVRVRAKFQAWSVRGQFEVIDPAMEERLQELFTQAGRYVGLCDWRPGSPKSPGPYGVFAATLKKVG